MTVIERPSTVTGRHGALGTSPTRPDGLGKVQGSFAFSSDLAEVTELFERNKIEDAIAKTLRDYSGGSTDYGQALVDFMSDSGKFITAMYYIVIAILALIIVFNYPDAIDYGDRNQFMLFFIVVSLPFLIVAIKRDISIYSNEKYN